MMNAINSFFGSILKAFDSFTGSYLLALFIFALLVKLILLPFGLKQQKNSVKQARLKPKEMAIRNKYRGRTDQPTMQKMNQEVMELYQQEGYSPLSGCLPMLIQFPIILILYKVITNPLRYICGYSKTMVTTIATYLTGLNIPGVSASGYDINLVKHLATNLDGINGALAEAGEVGRVVLEDLPDFSFFGLGGNTFLAANPSWTTWLVLVPILNFAFTMLSTWVMKKLTFQPMQAEQQGGSMKFMNIFMAAMTTFIAFSVPAAIGIYWIFNNLLGMLQQFILFKTMPLPKFTEEDYKAAEREYAGKSINKKENIQKVKAALARPMADEEYADLGDYVSVYDEKPVIEPEAPKADTKDKAPLKNNKNKKKKK